MKHIIALVTTICLVLAVSGQNIFLFKNSKGMYGFKDKTGRVVAEPKYYVKPEDFKEGRAVFSKANLKGVLDENGNEIVAAVYKNISGFNYGFAQVTKELTDTSKIIGGKPRKYELSGFIDRNGKEIVPILYSRIDGDFSNGWFVTVYNAAKEKLYYNTAGKTFAVPEGILLQNYRIDGKSFIASKNGKTGIIDQRFKELLPFEYDNIRTTENGMLIVRQNNLDGLMDNRLKWIMKPAFKRIYLFQNGFSIFESEDGSVGAVNNKGVVTAKPEFASISRIGNTKSAIAMFKQKGADMSGLVDLSTGKIIASARYYFTSFEFDGGNLIFRRDNRKGMMDSTGKEIFYDVYSDFSPGFLENRAWVVKDGKYGFIDKTGMLVIPAQYETVGGFNGGLAKVKLNGKYGYINADGKTVIPIAFTNADNFDLGMAWVKDETGKTFYIDKTGKAVE